MKSRNIQSSSASNIDQLLSAIIDSTWGTDKRHEFAIYSDNENAPSLVLSFRLIEHHI